MPEINQLRTKSLVVSLEVLGLALIVAVAAILIMMGCKVTPSGGGRLGMGSDPNTGHWAGGDSNSCPTFIRINGIFCIGVNGTGLLIEPTVSRQLFDALELYPAPQKFYVITGGNDFAAGHSMSQIISAAESFHDEVEAMGIDVIFVTEPLPDNGITLWNGFGDYNDWLVNTYPDTVDCAYAGHPTESATGPVPVHPTSAGYDNYATCIEKIIK